MGLGNSKRIRTEVGTPPDESDRKQRAIVKLWGGLALIDNGCARALVLSAIAHLAEADR
jgi:hypothetical protein